MKSVEEVLREFEEEIKEHNNPWSFLWKGTCQDIINYLSRKPSRKNALRWFRQRIRHFRDMSLCSLYIQGWVLLTGKPWRENQDERRIR